MHMKYLVSLIMAGLGILIVAKTFAIVRLVGKNDWAEQKLGSGGTYTAWKIIGVIVIIASYYVITKPEFFGLS